MQAEIINLGLVSKASEVPNTSGPALRLSVIVPIKNPGAKWQDWLRALRSQTYQPAKVLVVDSASTDQSVQWAQQSGCDILHIEAKDFAHGATRQLALAQVAPFSDWVVFLTQDAILASEHALENLLHAIQSQPQVAAWHGRQLPQSDASAIESHFRHFNYPAESHVVQFQDKEKLGLRACFFSNAYGAYRVADLLAIGGFPQNVILGEDTWVAAKLLKAGHKVGYTADSCVYHSHHYTISEEFRRMFDTGVFHAQNPWLRSEFGSAEKRGWAYVKSQWLHLKTNHVSLLPKALLVNAVKLIGFHMGLKHRHWSLKFNRFCSMHPMFWDRQFA